MQTDGYSLDNLQVAGNRIQAQVTVDSQSPWFQGHFPGNPVLPGVAQLIVVSQLIRYVHGNNIFIAGIRNVRFKRIVRPDTSLRVMIETSRKDECRYTFRIECDQELAGKGVLSVARKTAAQGSRQIETAVLI